VEKFSAIKLCEYFTNDGWDFDNFYSECGCVSVFSLWVFQALGMVQDAGSRGVGWGCGDRVR